MRPALLFAVLFTISLPLAAAPYDYTGFKVVKVTPSVYAYISAECTPSGVVSGNVTAIIGSDGVLVVDSGSFPRATRKIVAHLKSVTNKPVKYLVNTHWHQDHIVGNAEIVEAWPGLTILAHAFTAAELAKPGRGPGFPEAEMKALTTELDRVKKVLASGKSDSGKPLTKQERTDLQERQAAYSAELPEAPLMRMALPQVGLTSDTEVSLGNRTVKIQWLGVGNTQGDLVAYVPDEKILVTGDIVVSPTPFALGTTSPEWIATLAKLEAFDTAAIVPGHGELMKSNEYIRDLRRLIDTTLQQTKAAIAAGTPKEKALAQLDVAFFRKKYVTTKQREGTFDVFFLNPVVNSEYRRANAK